MFVICILGNEARDCRFESRIDVPLLSMQLSFSFACTIALDMFFFLICSAN
jgi:hypothetical protein